MRSLSLDIALALTLGAAGAAHADVRTFQGLQVEVRGSGEPVLFIPGLNSAASTWEATCEALRADRDIACHLVQLPGFAGLDPLPGMEAEGTSFLPAVRDRLLAYIEDAELTQPAVVGHSLGGVLGLMLATEAPAAVGPLVIVDSLPFFPAAMNAAATEASMAPMAQGMRSGMRAATDEAYLEQTRAAAGMGMSRDPARVEEIQQWGVASDRHTTTQAMYEMYSHDLRPALSAVRSPTLVLGAWAAYAPMGSTLESTRGIYEAQYAALDGVRIEMSESAYHFIMFDDQDWLVAQVREHLAQ